MGRGGQREGAGRKSGWTHSETQTIRVPKIFVAQILAYARQLDSGSEIPGASSGIPNVDLGIPEQFESDTVSELAIVQEVAPGQTSIFDFIDSVPESKLGPLRGIDLALRFRVDKGSPSRTNGRFKGDLVGWLAWTRKHDPEGLAWEFNPVDKLYRVFCPPDDNLSTSQPTVEYRTE
jgi:hypothetical protein